MTQLNLSGRQPNGTQQDSAAKQKDESIKNQTVGAMGALAMFAAVIVIGSCSRSSKPVAVQQPSQPTLQASAPAPTVPAPVPPLTVAKEKKYRAATLSYVNREYGLSFSFPRNYQLKKLPKVADATNEPLQMNFVQPGGVALAALEMPGNSYPGTDFKSGFIGISVNPGMTAEACTQFALPDLSTETGTDASSPVKTASLRVGRIEFHELEDTSRTLTKPADTKYYHAFSNGACYEFALVIATDGEATDNVEEITAVNRQLVLARLEKILATVKLSPAVMPETPAPVPAVAATTPAGTSTPAEHATAAPNF